MTKPDDLRGALPCEFVPANEPWTCKTHDGIRTRLDQSQCDVAMPAAPLNDAELANVRAAQPRAGRYLIRRLLANLDAALAASGAERPIDEERLARALRAPGVMGHHFRSADGTDGGYKMHDADEMAALLAAAYNAIPATDADREQP